MSNEKNKVFVYGTLKKGEPNHYWFSKDNGISTFICNAETVKKYPLIIGTKYNIPFLLYSPGAGRKVKGEVYEVDEITFKNLDILEDHPDFYIREEDEVESSDGQKHKVWIYFIKNFKPELLNKTLYETYTNNNHEGLRYVESENSTIDDLNNELL